MLTEQVAWAPHTPGHGSRHLLFMQARWFAHSGLIVHSCLHSTYGSPCSPGKHVQDAAPFLSLHSALIPHGLGLHGSIISGRGVVAINMVL